MNSFNLIPDERLKSARRRLHLRAWTRTLAIYVLALAAVAAGATAMTDQSHRINTLNAKIEKSTNKNNTLNTDLAAIAPQLQELHNAIKTAETIAQQPNWGVMLDLLADVKGSQVVLDRCSLEPVYAAAALPNSSLTQANNKAKTIIGYRLDIDGFGRTQREVSEFALILEQAKLFDRIDVKQTQRQQLMERSVTSFQMQGLLTAQVETP